MMTPADFLATEADPRFRGKSFPKEDTDETTEYTREHLPHVIVSVICCWDIIFSSGNTTVQDITLLVWCQMLYTSNRPRTNSHYKYTDTLPRRCWACLLNSWLRSVVWNLLGSDKVRKFITIYQPLTCDENGKTNENPRLMYNISSINSFPSNFQIIVLFKLI